MPKLVTDKNARAAEFTRGLLDRILILPGVCGIVILTYLFGWPQTLQSEAIMYGITDYMLLIFATCEIGALALAEHKGQYLRQNVVGLIMALTALFVSLDSGWILNASKGRDLQLTLLIFVTVTQIAVLLPILLKWLRKSRQGWMTKIQPRSIVIGSFVSLILIGTLLLCTPNATTHGISWTDALFTSTSAVCVTGLAVVDTATEFTLHGQFVILLLIQIGGLGLMTYTYFLAMMTGEGISLHDRVLLRDMLSERSLGYVSGLLLEIVLLTITIEIAGAILLYQFWHGSELMGGTVWNSIFHSISAFCNAGFSTLPGNLSNEAARNNRGLQSVIMIMIIMGGLGFPVLRELRQRALSYIFPKHYPKKSHMSLHSRLVLSVTAILLMGGTLLLYICQHAGAEGSTSPSLWLAMFDSVTARTAGFNIADFGAYSAPVCMVMLLLMLIGGSPAGTAGGIKTTTFALALLNLWTIVRDRKEIQIRWRAVSQRTANQAFAILVISLGWIFLAIFAMSIAEPGMHFLDICFESVSAFGTVGLSRGITADLSIAGKLIIIVTMFIGRIGLIVIANALLKAKRQTHYSLPQEQVGLT